MGKHAKLGACLGMTWQKRLDAGENSGVRRPDVTVPVAEQWISCNLARATGQEEPT